MTDTGDTQFWQSANNNFDRNIYIVTDDSFAHWTFKNTRQGWNDISKLGYEPNGELVIERAVMTSLSCDR